MYKQLEVFSSQLQPPRNINAWNYEEIESHMLNIFNPVHFVVRERFKFWTECKRVQGETIQELASKMRKAAATCDFTNISNPLDEALRTNFMCKVQNEAVLEALFRVPDIELFSKGGRNCGGNRINSYSSERNCLFGKFRKVGSESIIWRKRREEQFKLADKFKSGRIFNKFQSWQPNSTCYRCGNRGHWANACKVVNVVCNFCGVKGHLEKVCFKKHNSNLPSRPKSADSSRNPSQPRRISVNNARTNTFEQTDCPCRTWFWTIIIKTSIEWFRIRIWTGQRGKRQFLPCEHLETIRFSSFTKTKNCLQICNWRWDSSTRNISKRITFNVTSIQNLNLIGRRAMVSLNIDLNTLLRTQSISSIGVPPFQLRKKCELLCEEFNELFSPEVGCLKDFELEIRFKPDSRPIFVKPRTVPIAIQEELNGALEAGIRKGIWMPCEFNDYGTPAVPIRKRGKSGGIRVCGDYSVTMNSQLETHRQLMPTPEDLIRKLGGSRFFSKIDLADAYNRIWFV